MTENLDKAKQLDWFLQDACSGLGFCLPFETQENLMTQMDLRPSEFICAVIEPEGLDLGKAQNSEHFPPLMALYRRHVKENRNNGIVTSLPTQHITRYPMFHLRFS